MVIDICTGSNGTAPGSIVGVARVQGAVAVGHPIQVLLKHSAHCFGFR